MRELVTLVVPVFLKPWTNVEWAAFLRLISVLDDFSITFVTSTNQDVSFQQEMCQESTVYRFEERFFESEDGFRRLLFSTDFYEMFGWSEFMLIAPTDVVCCKNELRYWCKQGYDYIPSSNGAFSLRRVDYFMSETTKSKKGILEFIKKEADADFDKVFWMKKGRGFWPALRMPSEAILPYFSLPISKWDKTKKPIDWPFVIADLEKDNESNVPLINNLND